ncbi:MAG TPA: glutamate--cysteine ligase [Streptosporangiaceae bacterium]|nr:glutamate--cysteine ligase [Streptosporangiaceae bacterium]
MGTDIDQEEFDDSDHLRFAGRLTECLSALGQLLDRPGFGVGPATIGAELELFLVDSAGRPLPRNQVIRAAVADPRVTVELDRFNLELNASPVPLAGRPFAALGGELNVLLDHVAQAARSQAGRLALIGILPTLTRADFGPGIMTDVPRYRALDSGLRRLRQDRFRIRIAGQDPLELTSEDVALEGANSSFQVHLRVNPADFTRTYNAAQLATVPALAVSGNSPTFLGHRLWEETRIALFKQSVDDRQAQGPRRRPARTALGTGWLRGEALDLFTESVRLYQPLLPVPCGPGPRVGGPGPQAPPLNELRLHQGTVWRWNRAIYDSASGGHLRIEMRALPVGPTVVDMLANAAFLIGLTLWLAHQDQQWTYALPFERADHGFYRAAQHGLSARLTWPAGHRDQTKTLPASELVTELVPAARQGLLQAGVTTAEADTLLSVISARAASGRTGAAWQRATLAAAERRHGRQRALAIMFNHYLQCAETGLPVHAWPVVSKRE